MMSSMYIDASDDYDSDSICFLSGGECSGNVIGGSIFGGEAFCAEVCSFIV